VSDVFLGVDVGTQGVRVLAIDEHGGLAASARASFPTDMQADEQSPEMWWSAVVASLREVVGQLAGHRLIALSVTSTSGTVIPLDERCEPLNPALMYRDRRARAEAEEIAAIAPELGCGISWGLPKMLWYGRKDPRVRHWRHAADLLIGRLTGNWAVTDQTNALKSGYDLIGNCWPAELFGRLGLDIAQLPNVVPSGTVIGPIASEVAEETGLPPSLLVTTGMTDGCASQVASGAVRLGDWNTTLGTTMVIKGVTRNRVVDPAGQLYSHRHPEGWWMPGGASSTGAEWVERDFSGIDLPSLESAAVSLTPTGLISYPLRVRGERFPFAAPNAEGFSAATDDPARLFASNLEGVAYLERMAFELVERLSGERVGAVYSAGGGSKNRLWSQIRADVLQRPVHQAFITEGAAGVAVLAAGATRFNGLSKAATAMIAIAETIEPTGITYDAGYLAFVDALRSRGYLSESA
jgi:sugar (pentulose or hexulose) kinase